MGGGTGIEWFDLFRPLNIGMRLLSQFLDFFRLGNTKKLKSYNVFASVKEPDTAYSNKITRYGLLFLFNSEDFKLLTFD